jgi:hypothetical protein
MVVYEYVDNHMDRLDDFPMMIELMEIEQVIVNRKEEQ